MKTNVQCSLEDFRMPLLKFYSLFDKSMMPKLTFGKRATFTLVTCLSIKHPKIFQGALSICFHKEVHSHGHYISHFIDKQVTSVKVTRSPKVSFGIMLLSNKNRILTRAF